MGKTQPLPILITGGGRRIGLALAWHFINQKQPVIVSYRTHYPAIDGLINAGAQRSTLIPHTCSTMRWKDYCVGTDTPPAISFTLPIMWWSAVATNILRMLQAKRHWII